MDKSIVIIIRMIQALLAAALDLSGGTASARKRVEDIWRVGESELARVEASDRRRRRKKGG